MDSESPPTNAAPVTPWDNHPSCLGSHWSVCVVLFNGRHWHDSSSLPPTACHQIATLAAGKHSLAPVRRLDACILASKKFCLKGAIPLRCLWFWRLLLSVAKTRRCVGISDSSSVIWFFERKRKTAIHWINGTQLTCFYVFLFELLRINKQNTWLIVPPRQENTQKHIKCLRKEKKNLHQLDIISTTSNHSTTNSVFFPFLKFMLMNKKVQLDLMSVRPRLAEV